MPNLGLKNGRLLDCPSSPNCVNSQAKDDAHLIQPIVFIGNAEEAKGKLLNVIGEMKNTKVVTAEPNYVHVEFKSTFFRFVDDVEFYFPKSNTTETTIQVRSASRVGHSDFGVNRKRIEKIRNAIKP